MKSTIPPENNALLERMERLLRLQNAATQLELFIKRTRELDARKVSYDRVVRQENSLRSR